MILPPGKEQSTIYRLMTAAQEILDFVESRQTVLSIDNPQITIPIWIDLDRKILITLERGPATEARHAIFIASAVTDD